MKADLNLIGQPGAGDGMRRAGFGLRLVALLAGVLISAQLLQAERTVAHMSALPDATMAAVFVSEMASGAVPTVVAPTFEERAAVSLIEAGFLIGTTTAVHELGHARQVRSAGGRSHWETGDVNWWSYLVKRQPLSSGATEWLIPAGTSVDNQISILAGGFNATTSWDEATGGRGSYGLITARYSMIFYDFSGVSAAADDLTQIEAMYANKGYNITRREMQGWQLLAGVLSQFGGPVRAYAYLTPGGVSVRAVTHWRDWSVAAETVVHGSSAVEVELGRRFCPTANIELLPKVLVSDRGVGGALTLGARFGRTRFSFNGQFVNPRTLLGSRATTSYNLEIATRL